MTAKKLGKSILILLVSIVLLAMASTISNKFFFNKIAEREAERRSLPQESANSIKHAYAASLVYSTARFFFLSENAAKNFTISLGKFNEILEAILKLPKDSTLEMMKDLGNNLAGICAAKLIEENPQNPAMQDRIGLIGNMAENNELILTHEDVELDPAEKQKARESSNYEEAAQWFEHNKDKIVCSFGE